MVRGGGVLGWLGHKDGALRNGISTRVKETPESRLPPYTTSKRKPSPIYDPEVGPPQTLNLPGT